MTEYDAVVVGSGPNGLSAAVELSRRQHRVLVLEGAPTIGGGTRTSELTLPGFHHDVCSAVHTTGVISPFFRQLPLAEHGLRWSFPDASVAHPLDDGSAVLLTRSLDETADNLGSDADAYRRLLAPLLADPTTLLSDLLGPLRWPKRPLLLSRFGLSALRSARGLASGVFSEDRARALFAGCAAHSILPLERLGTAAVGLVFLLIGHVENWPVATGGSQAITRALASYLESLGGEIRTSHPVASLADIPPSRAVLFDLNPRQLLEICGDQLPAAYRWRLGRYRYGPGVFKLDWALDGPIPWKAEACARAATVHIGGRLDEISIAEAGVFAERHAEQPFVLLCQQSLFDATRAPTGRHTGYAYCHVPAYSDVDMTEPIEAQVERFAPGFKQLIAARHAMSAAAFEAYNPSYLGGAITGGISDLWQLFTRPVARLDPYRTPNPRFYLCSHSTPPGGGVHGMCGYFAARSVLRRWHGRHLPTSEQR